MGNLDGPVLACVLGGIEALGLLSAWLARVGEGSRHQAGFQRFFLGCLALIGAAAMVSLGLPPGYWLSCGVTLAVMVLMATCDFDKTGCATVW